MGDSDEEYDKRRGRDKFRRERPDYQPERRERGGWEESRGRGEWRGKRDRTDSYGDRNFNRGSPPRYGSPPQAKRMKRDWDDYDPTSGNMPPPSSKGDNADSDFPTQPPMMTFKSFLQQQEDNITDEEAIRKFNEYKLDFKKQQINEFFLQHKDEEWFKSKYSPEDYSKKKADAAKLVKMRCEVFAKLLEIGLVAKASVDVDNNANVIKLLDAAVILMEGGTDFDLQCLEEEHQFYKAENLLSRQTSEAKQAIAAATKAAEAEKQVTAKTDTTEAEKPAVTAAEEETTATAAAEPEKKMAVEDDEGDGELKSDGDEDGEEKVEDQAEKKETEEPKDESDAPKPETEADAEETKPDESEETATKKEEGGEGEEENKEKDLVKENGIKKKKKKRRKKDFGEIDGDSDDSDSGSESESEAEENDKTTEEPPPPGMEGADSESYNPSLKTKEEMQTEEKEQDTKEEAVEEGEPSPRPLHKTQSVFLRNLAPSISKAEIEAMCRTYPGFLRLALQDPAPERKFFRRGWATFDRSVNIKEICWNITNIRLKDQELGAIVNKELKQRVRPVNGITSNRQVSKADVKHCAKIVQNYDKRWGLWTEDSEKKDNEKKPRFGLISNNPVLKNITDYLVDEGSYEEEAYLGKSLDESPDDGNHEVALDRDEDLLKVLDRMILYLRIVHSFDYYSCVEYPSEDEMPHRCGIMHGRGPKPINRVTQNEIEEWIGVFDRKIAPWEELKVTLTEAEAKRLGKKEPDAEVEKFIQANTQELAKDKWLCPLSGKKFKGPDFVRKHMQNKHGEKLDEVKQEVVYFNNFLMDPKRPGLPEHPANKSGGVPSRAPPDYNSGAPSGSSGGYGPPSHHSSGGYGAPSGGGGYNSYRGGGGPPMSYGRGRGGPPMRGGYHQSSYGSRGGYNNYEKPDYRRDRSYDRPPQNSYPPPRRDRSRPDPRGIVEYRDLDALKEDSDTFFVLDES